MINLGKEAELADCTLVQPVPVRVILSDPDPLARDGIRNLLSEEQRIAVVGITADSENLINKLTEHEVDAALVDISLISQKDFAPLVMLKRLFPECRVVAVGTATRSEVLLKALRLGVNGYVLKSGSIAQFRAALHEVLVGESLVLPDMAQQLLSHMIQESSAPKRESSVAKLSQRENEVLKRLIQGMSNKEIAADLEVTNRTVKAHVSKILLKMGVADRTQAVVKVLSANMRHLMT